MGKKFFNNILFFRVPNKIFGDVNAAPTHLKMDSRLHPFTLNGRSIILINQDRDSETKEHVKTHNRLRGNDNRPKRQLKIQTLKPK